MSDLLQAAKQLVTAWRDSLGMVEMRKAINAIEAAIEQIHTSADSNTHHCEFTCSTGLCYYKQPLTDERVWLEYMQLWPFRPNDDPTLAKDILRFARAIEAAHGIKGKE